MQAVYIYTVDMHSLLVPTKHKFEEYLDIETPSGQVISLTVDKCCKVRLACGTDFEQKKSERQEQSENARMQ